MNPRKIAFFLLLLLPLISLPTSQTCAADGSALSILDKMINTTKKIKTLRFTLKKRERIDGKMVEQASAVKMCRSPYKVYMRQSSPKDGLEVLLNPGWNDDKALINTNGFPWVNVSLDPNGAKMRDGQHHCMYQSGFDLGMDILHFLLFEKYKSDANNMVKVAGTINWKGHSCYQILLENDNFGYNTHTVKQGETVLSISEKYMVNEYMILALNDDVSGYWDVKAGQQIKVPNDYASRMVIYVEKDRMVPRFMQVYDEKGLFEQYEYLDLEVNPTFSDAEFTPEFPEYGF